MSETNRKAAVYIQNVPAGRIEETEEGYLFSYDSAYLERTDAVAASITLPLRKEPYFSEVLFPFFDGMIPEGWLLQVIRDTWKLDRRDRFGALLAACRDCIGDVSIRREE